MPITEIHNLTATITDMLTRGGNDRCAMFEMDRMSARHLADTLVASDATTPISIAVDTAQGECVDDGLSRYVILKIVDGPIT